MSRSHAYAVDEAVAATAPRPRGTWFHVHRAPVGLDAAKLDALDQQGVGIDDPASVLMVGPTEPYATFELLGGLLRQVLPVVSEQIPELVARHHSDIGFVTGSGSSGARAGLIAGPDAVTFAIVRRISRESMPTATAIDGVARFLLAALAEAPGLRRVRFLAVDRFSLVDRPSLRVLVRLRALDDRPDPLQVVLLDTDERPALADPRLLERLDSARSRFTEHLRALTGALDVDWPGGDSGRRPAPAPRWVGGADVLTPLSDALVNQNYDAVYVAAQAAFNHAADAATRSNVHRLTGLADANTGDHEAALAMFDDALRLATDRCLAGHLWYLKGLLGTKRFYDLDGADRCFDAGLAALPPEPRDGRARFEQAWLLNGKALVLALRARRAGTEPERDDLLAKAMRTELTAFDLVPPGKEPAHVYLRYNLLANLTFLLEIMGQFGEAVSFWDRAFGQFLGLRDREAFERSFRYREAMLRCRAGEHAVAAHELDRALAAAEAAGERFAAQYVAGALGYARLLESGPAGAVEGYLRAATLAGGNRDDPALTDHLTAAARCAAACGEPELAARLIAAVDDLVTQGRAVAPDSVEPGAPVTVRSPSPKLPAYVPLIDLEPPPKQDLNRYLAHGPVGPTAVI